MKNLLLLFMLSVITVQSADKASVPTKNNLDKTVSVLIINGERARLVNRIDYKWINQLHKQNIDFDFHYYGRDGKALSWNLVKDYNVLIIINPPPHYNKMTKKKDVDKQSEIIHQTSKVLKRYIKAGGGIFFMPDLGDEPSIRVYGCKAWLEYLAPWGIKVCSEYIFDPKTETKHPRHGRKFIYTNKIAASPVSKGVEGIWFPNDPNKFGYRYASAHGMPIYPTSKDWTVVVRGGDGSYSKAISAKAGDTSRFSKNDIAEWSKQRFFRPDKTIPPGLFAIRNADAGRMAISIIRPVYHFHGGASWIHNGVLLDKGLKGKSSDFSKLMVNTIHWLAAPSLKKSSLGGYVQNKSILIHPHLRKSEKYFSAKFDSYQNTTLPKKVYRGIIGAQSAYSSGSGTVADWAKEARKAKLGFIIFMEDHAEMTPDKCRKLNEECKKYSSADLVLIPGFTIKNNIGNYEWYQGYGLKLPPKHALDDQGRLKMQHFTKDGKITYSGQAVARSWRWHYAAKNKGLNIGYYNFKNSAPGSMPVRNLRLYSFLGIVTYIDGKFVENITNDYLKLLPQTNTPKVCTVSILKSPAEMVKFLSKNPYLTNIAAMRVKDIPRLVSYGHQYGRGNINPSSGPKIQSWAGNQRVMTYAGESFVTRRYLINPLAKISSDIGLKEIRIYRDNGKNGAKLFRRIKLNGKKEYIHQFKWGYDRHSMLALEAVDVKGGRAISSSFEYSQDGNWHTWCRDRYNGELWHGPFEVKSTWETGVRNPYSVGNTWDGGGSLTRYIGFNLRTDNPVLKEDDGTASGKGDSRRMEGYTFITCIDDTVRNIGGIAWNVYAPGKVANAYHTLGPIKPSDQLNFSIRRTEYMPRILGPHRDTHPMNAEREGGALAMYEGNMKLLRKMKLHGIYRIGLLNMISFFGDNQPVWIIRSNNKETSPLVYQNNKLPKKIKIQPGGYIGVTGSIDGTPSMVFNMSKAPVIFRAGKKQHNIDLGDVAGKTFNSGDQLYWKLLYVYDSLNHQDRSPARAEYIRSYFGLDGKGGKHGLELQRGKELSSFGLVDLEAQNGVVEFTVPEPAIEPKLDIPLGVRFYGFNPNWTVGLYQISGFTPGFYNKDGKNLYRNLALDDNNIAYLAVYTHNVPLTRIIAGHPIVADNKNLAINVAKLSDKPSRWYVSVNNLTDGEINTTIKVNMPEIGIPFKTSRIKVPPGAYKVLLDQSVPKRKVKYVNKRIKQSQFVSWVQDKDGNALRIDLSKVSRGQYSHKTGVICSLSGNQKVKRIQVSFDARAVSGSRILQVRRPWGGGNIKKIRLSNTWSPYHFNLDSKKLDYSGGLIFALSRKYRVEKGIVEIKNVKILALDKQNKITGGNLAKNGTFEKNTNGWSGYENIRVPKKNKK